MNLKARKNMLNKINRKASKNSLLQSIDREYNLYEIAIITRAGQAKALGLTEKGHLGLNADADIAIYNLNPKNIIKSKEIRNAFKKTLYTIKNGEIVVKDGEIVKPVNGKTLWVKSEISSPTEISEDMKKRFREYYTVEFENYSVPEKYLDYSEPILTKAEI